MLNRNATLCALALAALLITGCESAHYTSATTLAPATPPPSFNTAAKLPSTPHPLVSKIPTSPDEAYNQTLKIWAAGNQLRAEADLDKWTTQYPKDQRLAFFRALCARSRFYIQDAHAQLAPVENMAPRTPEGLVAHLITKLDRNQDPALAFKQLALVFIANQHNPLIIWAITIEARNYHQYSLTLSLTQTLLKEIAPAPGPAPLNESYAALLDATGNFTQALKHRQLAVQMEPAGYTYHGLATTLTHLRRYDEANTAYQRAVFYDPYFAYNWQSWAWSLQCAGKYADAIDRCQKARLLDKTDILSWEIESECDISLNKLPAARAALQQAIKLAPNQPDLHERLAVIYQKLGDKAGAAEERTKAAGHPEPNPVITKQASEAVL